MSYDLDLSSRVGLGSKRSREGRMSKSSVVYGIAGRPSNDVHAVLRYTNARACVGQKDEKIADMCMQWERSIHALKAARADEQVC